MMGFKLSRDDVLRILIAQTIEETRTRDSATRPAPERIGAGTILGAEELGLDGAEFMALTDRIGDFFSLRDFDLKAADLEETDLATWADAILRDTGTLERITFATTDPMGRATRCTHEIAHLREEAKVIAARLRAEGIGSRNVLVANMAPASPFGFIYTVLVPMILDCTVMDAWQTGLPPTLPETRAVIIAQNGDWQAMTGARFASGTIGITPAHTLCAATLKSLREGRLCALWEIFFHDETLGLGQRARATQAFTLLPHWQRRPDGRLIRDNRPEDTVTPPELMIWEPARAHENGPRRFRPAQAPETAPDLRHRTVHAARIASVMCDHDAVERCGIQIAQTGDTRTIRAHVILKHGLEPSAELARMLETWCRIHLPPEERPRLIRFDQEVNLPGELMDGPITAFSQAVSA